jgi:hypothetical protein
MESRGTFECGTARSPMYGQIGSSFGTPQEVEPAWSNCRATCIIHGSNTFVEESRPTMNTGDSFITIYNFLLKGITENVTRVC